MKAERLQPRVCSAQKVRINLGRGSPGERGGEPEEHVLMRKGERGESDSASRGILLTWADKDVRPLLSRSKEDY